MLIQADQRMHLWMRSDPLHYFVIFKETKDKLVILLYFLLFSRKLSCVISPSMVVKKLTREKKLHNILITIQ